MLGVLVFVLDAIAVPTRLVCMVMEKAVSCLRECYVVP